MTKNKKNNKKRKTTDNTENVYLVSYFTWSIRLSSDQYKYEVKTKEVVAKNRYEAYKKSGVTSILNIIPLFDD